MIKSEDNKLIMELPWETVELIIRNALTDDLKYNENDNNLHQALERVLEYYGGAIE